jgi:hypothetical protein
VTQLLPTRCARLPVRLTVSERDGRRIACNVSLVAEEPRGRGATPELQRPLRLGLERPLLSPVHGRALSEFQVMGGAV